jgi:hypothetical protein
MEKIVNSVLLKEKIHELRLKEYRIKSELSQEFENLYDQVKPINFIKNTFKEAFGLFDINRQVVNTTLGITLGLFAKKIISGNSNKPIMMIFGTIVELVTTVFFTKNADSMKSWLEEFMSELMQRSDTHENEEY